MDISLSTQLDAFVSREVNSGRYASAGEVISEALSLLEECAARRSELDRELGRRLDEMDRGKRGDLNALQACLKKKSRERQNVAA